MFLNKGNQGKNSFSLFCLSFTVIILFFAVIGNLPMTIAVLAFSKIAGSENLTTELSSKIGFNLFFILALIPFLAGLFGILISVKYIHKRSVLSVFSSRETFSWKRFFYSFRLWGIVMLGFFASSYCIGAPIYYNFNPVTFFPLLIISLVLLPIQTTFEEVLFRGYLFQGLGVFFKRGWISVLITGVLFGLMHGANPEVDRIGTVLLIFYIMTGLFLGIVTLMDDGLELSMGYHAINNIFAAIIVTNDWQAFHTDALFIDKSPPQFGIENILTLLILQPLLLYVFAKKYKWTNWKERLFNKDFNKIG